MSERMMLQRNKAVTPTFTPPTLLSSQTHGFTVRRTAASPQAITEVDSGVYKTSSAKNKHETPSLQAQLDRASRKGHHFGRVQVHASTPSSGVQTKLTVGKPGDKYEQEADRVADQVMAMTVPTQQQQIQRQTTEEEEEQVQTKSLAATPSVQLQTTEEEEPVQAKSLSSAIPTIQLQTAEGEEEEQVQTKPSLQRTPTIISANSSSSLESRLASQKGGGSPLSNEVRAFMEPRFDADFSQVRIHTNSDAVQMNRELNAQAFAHGRDIYFGAGKYNPGSSDGKHLLAHELTHVVQQTGRIQPKNAVSQPIVKRVKLPASLRSDIGKVDYYLLRLRDYNKRHIKPPAPDYYLNYGDKYARRFTYVLKSQLSPKGQAWVDRTFVMLQQAIENKRDADPKAFDLLEQKADKFKDFAYETHSKAYLDGGLRDLSIRDLYKIGTTPDLGDIFTYSGITQVLETGRYMFIYWGAQGSDWLLDKAKQMMGKNKTQVEEGR